MPAWRVDRRKDSVKGHSSFCVFRQGKPLIIFLSDFCAPNKFCGQRPQGSTEYKKAKKIAVAIVAAFAAALLAVAFAACTASYAGTYKFSSMSVDMGGVSVEYVAGEKFLGVAITEDAFVLEIKDDNTWTMTANFLGETEITEGTWRSDGGLVLVAESDSEIVVRVDGNTLVMTQTEDGTTASITFKKQ